LILTLIDGLEEEKLTMTPQKLIIKP
jgi:hypothetical protein